MSVLTNIIFHNEATTIGNGEEYTISSNYNADLIVVLDITGTATSRTLTFQSKGRNGNWIDILGYNATDATASINTISVDDELWKFDITGYEGFRVKITAIAGGNVTVLGKVVS